MPSRNENPNRSESFGRLLSGAINSIATYEGRIAPVVEEELGKLLNLSGKTIQRYKAGALPPEHETVKVLAEAAIRRGYLGREWLQRFLHAARYPFADKLLNQLCPLGPARPRPPHVYHNLPAPTYSQFVMRAEAFAEVREGLRKQSAIVLIVGLGGTGKTSLAREVAARCLQDDDDPLRFDAVVWVSDKDRPGITNLSVVLDEIARTLDYPGFTQFEHDEKRREVENLLRRQRVLIVVDNFETITDGALLAWLQTMSEPSKALITAREYRRAFRRGGWLVELRGMTDAESREFVTERLRVLRIEKLVNDPIQLEPLVTATSGNPKAIEITLGLVKHERRPLPQVVDDLYAARGELFNDLFTRAWALLDEAARQVLLVTTFFPTSASGEALSAATDMQGYAFDRAVERLTDLALLDVQQKDLTSAPRYALHPLVRAFATAKLAGQSEFEASARERWVAWCIDLATQVGYCWDHLDSLELLDSEQEAVYAALEWTFRHGQYAQALRIAKGIEYYYYERGFWDKKIALDQMYIESARQQADRILEVLAMAYHVYLLSKRGDISSAEPYLPLLSEALQGIPLPDDAIIDVKIALAVERMSHNDLDSAYELLRSALALAERHPLLYRAMVLRWLVACLYRKGRLSEAYEYAQAMLSDAINAKYPRGEIHARVHLATISLDWGDVRFAEAMITSGQTLALQYQAREQCAILQRAYARLHTLRGDLPAAHATLTEAIDLFERLGMRRELAEARESLADLEAREQAELAVE